MQVYALDLNNRRIFVERAERSLTYTCLECGNPVRLRGGPHIHLHFYHVLSEGKCRLNGKSSAHIRLQQLIQKSCGGNCEQEFHFKEINRIADVIWPEKRIIFEVQCSPITADEVKKRIADYASVGFAVIWILHDQEFNKRKVSAAEAFLRAHTHYFAYQDCIYDQCDVISKGIRYKRFFQTPLDVAKLQIYEHRDRDVFTPFPQVILQRLATWQYHIQGDLLDTLIRKDFKDVLGLENEVLPKMKKRTFRCMLKSFLKAIYNYLIEQSCR